MAMIMRLGAAMCSVLLLALPVQAERAPQIVALLEALKISDTIGIMQEEGIDYGEDVANQLLPDADAGSWAKTVARIYDHDKMFALIAAAFEAELGDTDLTPVLDYFQSDDGAEIVTLEVSARRAFLDSDTEAAAADRYQELSENGAPLIEHVATLMRDSDLVEMNVAGTLNSDLMFYRGLTDGGAFEMSEDEMLADVWAQEEDLRRSSEDWLKSFLAMAYQPLSAEQLEAYAIFYRSPEGRDLNRAIFVAFDQMYEEISYLLGRAVAQQMQSEKL